MYSQLFYKIKPLITRKMQFRLRRFLVAIKLKKYRGIWPINRIAAKKPDWFKRWPDGKTFALLITHDVEHIGGLRNVDKLSAIDNNYNMRSSFGFVPERYQVQPEKRELLRKNGFEIYVHDLNHDGKLFLNYHTFHSRATIINRYLKEWNVVGFRAGSMHHNLDWIGELDIKYDMSTFDTDPFEPMPDGMNTIFPFIASSTSTNKCYVEIPYTLPQDLMTLVIHPKHSIDIWIEKINWIAQYNGMVSVNVHPDYIAFENKKLSFDNYPVEQYHKLLSYIQTHFAGKFWNPLPSELSEFVYNAAHEEYRI